MSDDADRSARDVLADALLRSAFKTTQDAADVGLTALADAGFHVVQDGEPPCDECGGSGLTRDWHYHGDQPVVRESCPACSGEGR